MKLENKTAIITGASTGIGRAIAIKFASEGAKTILIARSKDGLEETLKIVKQAGGEGILFCLDLRSVDEIKKFAKQIKESEKEIDILVNVAGVWHSKDKAYSGIDFAHYSTDEILDTYAVGLTAPTILSHELIPLMRKGGKVINISGTFENGAKGWLPYFVSKKAIEDLTLGLSQEFRDQQIQVNCISPSDVATEEYKKYFPEFATAENALQPEDVADLALFLASRGSDHITGQVIEIKQRNVKN
ncbi:MAG: SDR family oxidoreductase [Minisyncoccia bacterium]